ncbi:hypothetical protein D9619_001179 [Psilocybe cf. subviscida]|uniref:Response regulatory domain-containing protein n=1 Tax=Psilocybe cf. subviscida TaxID=2480587 RepID=A0A8H5BFL4_9AGAR|nr:hypothetical protein D9619_001179 [Psilocybe cf. subviscida]
MSVSKLPAVRMTAEGDCIIEDAVALDPLSSSKFSVSYAGTDGRQNPLFSPTRPEYGTLNNSSSDNEQEQRADDEEGESTDDGAASQPPPTQPSSPTSPTWSRRNTPQHPRTSPVQERPPAYMSRTLSMPLPSQLSHLQNPHRPGAASRMQSSPLIPSGLNQSRQVRDVSIELADSIQLVIQTLLQVSPPQVLDPVKEQFSACSLSIPTSSMSALFTAMKNINYISANMQSFCEHPNATVDPSAEKISRHNEFDIGEMLQCVGDALSGVAAQAGVDLVIYHGDVGLKHVYVSGDESGISFLLSHIVRQILDTAEHGDSIELGLLVSPISSLPQGSMAVETPPVDDLLTSAPLQSSGPVRITIRVSHKYAPSDTHQGGDHPRDVVTTEIRPKPAFSTFLVHRILQDIGGTLKADLPPPENFTSGRTCDFEMILERVPVPLPTAASYELDGISNDPTLEQLASFGETLKGKGVTLYASAKGSFAHHLTSYLTAWGMDVTHVSPDGQIDGLGDTEDARLSSYNQLMGAYPDGTGPESNKVDRQERPSFIFIDDNVDILKERLQALRFEGQTHSTYGAKKRPSLATTGRMRSTSNIHRASGFITTAKPANNIVIVHFTSLSQYKVVKDVMQSVAISYAATGTALPEVMVVPKPAGPRRFLTALHTAVTKPTVDPIFTPIATSPMSPGLHRAPGSFFGPSIHEYPGSSPGSNTSSPQMQSPAGKPNSRPSSNRSNSDRSTRSKDGNGYNSNNQIPPSPLALPDNVEYFSSAAQKLGSSPSSGLVIQSPDGQTAGIYFHPRNKNTSRNPSSQSMERDRGQLAIPVQATRYPNSRVASGNKKDDISFSALHEAATQSALRLANPGSPISPVLASVSPTRTSALSPVALDDESAPALLPTSISRRSSDEPQKQSSPTLNGDGVSTSLRRNTKRTDSKDVAGTATKKSKSSVLSDANIVPPISVLIVDDNPINQTILSTFMKRKKIKYESASNGQEAVEKWKTGGFHLILMDIQMPVMDGIQATTEIRRLEKLNAAAGYPPTSPTSEGTGTPSGSTSATSDNRSLNSPYRSSVIIVALTASSLQSDRVAALAAGCNDFLTKPVSLLWLNNKIIEWGSIKALQMWADIRPEAVSSIQSGQAAKARNVADRLHVPPKLRSSAQPPPAVRRTSSALEDNAAALALASSGGHVPYIPPSPTASMFKIPEQAPRPPSQLTEPETSSMMDISPTLSAPSLPAAMKRRRSEDITEDDDTPKPGSPSKGSVRHASSLLHQSRSVTPKQRLLPVMGTDPQDISAQSQPAVAATPEQPEHLNTPQSDGTSPTGALPPEDAIARGAVMDEMWP